jgi:hypothetical protein
VYINNPVILFAHRVRVLLIATLLAAVFGSVLASQASAYGGSENFCGSTLLGKAQICTSAVGKSTEYIFNISGENTTNGNAICVGPVTWNGKEYSAPYGYSCGGADYDWEFTPISSVAAAVENPNGVSEKIGGLFDWKEYPPVATTESASGIQPLQATLNGTLNPERSQAYYYFQYGKTTSYGSSTGEQSAGSGTSNEKEFATISGLEEGTTYHYRLVVKNAVGTTYGGDQAFTTLHKPEASTTAASAVMEEEATLNGTVNPKGSSTKYDFQYGETTSYGKTTSEGSAGSGTSGVAENATVTGLQPGLTYHYRIVATSAGGTSYGSDQTLNTSAAPAVTFDPSGNGDIYVATRGTNGALYVTPYSSGSWSGPYQEAAPGTVYSTPSISSDEAGDLFFTYEGANHTAEVLVRTSAGKFEGPFQEAAEGSMFSASASSSAEGNLFWSYEGPKNKFETLVRNSKGVEGPFQEAAEGSMFSAPSSGQDSAGNLYWGYQGPKNKFEVLVRSSKGVEGPFQEAAEGSTFSGAATSTNDSAGDFYWFFVGPKNTLTMIERKANGTVTVPKEIGGEGTAG